LLRRPSQNAIQEIFFVSDLFSKCYAIRFFNETILVEIQWALKTRLLGHFLSKPLVYPSECYFK
jgi:hypothetical protein